MNEKKNCLCLNEWPYVHNMCRLRCFYRPVNSETMRKVTEL